MKKIILLIMLLLLATQVFGWGRFNTTIFKQKWLELTESLTATGAISLMDLDGDTGMKISITTDSDTLTFYAPLGYYFTGNTVPFYMEDNSGDPIAVFNMTTSDHFEFTQPVDVGPVQGATDGGMQLLANVPVSASATVDSKQGWYISVGSSPVFTVKGEALDAGGVDAMSVEVNGALNFASDAQADDDYEISIPSISALTVGMTVTFIANTANTDGCTLEITEVGDVDAILKMHDTATATGDIESGQVVTVVWDGTNWQMTSQIAQ